MKIRIAKQPVDLIRDEIIAAGIFEGSKRLGTAAARINKHTAGMIKDILASGDFTGKLYQTMLLYVKKGLKTNRVLLVGLGKEDEFTPERLRGATASAANRVRDLGLKKFVCPLGFAHVRGLKPGGKARACVEGMLLGLYRFDEFKSKKATEQDRLGTCTILVDENDALNEVRAGVKEGRIIAEATCMVRSMVARPGNSATPTYLAGTARSIARREGLKCSVLDARSAKKMGMGAFLGVARGSDEPARFIVLEYVPVKTKAGKPIVVVGKAITFDSGGISLKPANNMEEMKTDMAGGAAVLGILQACARLKIPRRVVGIVPATENLPSGSALKPGDVITAMSGKTIEIISTDAEGRLILADALTYAHRFKPDAIIDMATLTGACIIALGNDVSGMMGTDERLISCLKAAGEATGDRVWQLPLYEQYGELIKSDIADIKNVGGRPAGTITAGYFLKEFVGEVPWVHIDIAGTAWTKTNKPCAPKGATGAGVRLIIEMLRRWQD